MNRGSWVVIVAGAVALASGCKSSSDTAGPVGGGLGPAKKVELLAAGSAPLGPLMEKWSAAYAKASGVHVAYDASGAGAGLRKFLARSVQMGTIDSPMTDEQLKESHSPVVHIPLTMGAVVPIYNLPGLAHTVRFTAETLSGVFLGEIKRWNDPKMAAANPHLDLPDTAIAVVHRSDGSGVTYKLTEYFTKVSPTWKSKLGTGFELAWPAGLGAKGDEGVATAVQQTVGAVGYTEEPSYALQHQLPMAELKNQAGNFIEASIESVSASAVGEIPDDLRYSLADASPPQAWPISGTTWAVVYADLPPGAQRNALVGFLRWAIRDGQKLSAPLNYAPLPPELLIRIDGKLSKIERIAE